jgi:hypothetical protein
LYFSSLEFHFANSNLIPVETECLTKKPRRAAKPGSLLSRLLRLSPHNFVPGRAEGVVARSLAPSVSAQVVIGSQPFIWVERPSVAAQPGLVPWVSAWALPAPAAVQPMAEPAAQAFSGRVVARPLDALATLLSVSRIATQPTTAQVAASSGFVLSVC